MLRTMWVRVTGTTVFAFPEKQTNSQLTDRCFQVGAFRGDGVGNTSALAFTATEPVLLGHYLTRLEAIAAILRHHEIVPTHQSVGIR